MTTQTQWFRFGCTALIGSWLTYGASAHAQESETIIEKGGPSRSMLTAGVITFGTFYAAGAVVGATSDREADHKLLVPFVGPWMALSNRGDCGPGAPRSCDAEATNKVLIIGDGIFQALGGMLVIGAFLNPQTRIVRSTASTPIEIHLRPASLVGNAYGISATGLF